MSDMLELIGLALSIIVAVGGMIGFAVSGINKRIDDMSVDLKGDLKSLSSKVDNNWQDLQKQIMEIHGRMEYQQGKHDSKRNLA